MRTRTARWDTAVLKSHRLAISASIIYNWVTVRTDVAIVAGSITLDRTAGALSRCDDVQLAEPTLIPTIGGGVFTPYGYELAIQCGIDYEDGTTELLPLGVYPIQRSNIDGVSLLTRLSAIDRTQRVRDARFTDDYPVTGAVDYAVAIRSLITAQVPGLDWSQWPAAVSYTTPTGLVYAAGSDPWDAASEMAKACGYFVAFDGLGRPILTPEPTFTATPVWEITEGDAGTLTAADLSLDRAPAYNAVVATGENSAGGQIYRAIATDNNPGSPTYWLGGFGQKPRFYASPLIGSTAQAQSAADALLQSTRGVARSLAFGAIPNVALEPGDAVLVYRSSLNLNEVHLVDSLRIDLGTGAMSGTSRANQL